MRKLILPAGLVITAAFAAWWWLVPAAATTAPRLRTAVADRGGIVSVVTATGTVNPSVSVQVSSQLSGNVRELFADFNTRVTKGQPLLRLDTAANEAKRAAAAEDHRTAQAQVAVARAQAEKAEADGASAAAAVESMHAQVARAEAALADAEADARRKTDLRARGVGAASEAERAVYAARQARASLAAARADVVRAEAEARAAAARIARAQVDAAMAASAQKAAVLRQVEVDLEKSWIRAPIDGVVVSRAVDIGQTVASSFQAPVLFQIAGNLADIEIWATVDEADIGRIRRGQEASFTVSAFPGESFEGRVKDIRLAPTTVQNVVTYTVVISARNDDERLLPGMTATLRVVAAQRPDALRVPNAALRWRPAGGDANASATPGPGDQVDEVLAALPDLTATQRAEIEAARTAFRTAMAEAGGDSRRLAGNQALRRMLSRLNAVLTPAQRARLSELRGAGARGGLGTVWVVAGDGAPRAVRVRTGLTDGAVTEIIGGDLAEGAAVVVGQERAAPSAAAGSGWPRL